MGTINKAEIVQRLLDSKHITAEEAVVLLSTTELQIEKKPIFMSGQSYGIPWLDELNKHIISFNPSLFTTSSFTDKNKPSKK